MHKYKHLYPYISTDVNTCKYNNKRNICTQKIEINTDLT